MPASDDLVITYTATLDEDYLEHGVYKYYRPHNGSKTLAVQRIKGRLISIAVHGNSKVAVKRGTKDVSDKYVCRRYWRTWEAALAQGGGARAEPYHGDDRAFLLDGAGTKAAIDSWFDVPGTRFLTRWVSWKRILIEFVVGCQLTYSDTLQQGVGGLHLVILLDLSPTGYRLSLSKGFDLTEDQVRSVMGEPGHTSNPFPSDGPLKTEDNILAAEWLAQHTAWQDYASVNAQLPLPPPQP